eukprot:CAMPEP_0115691718 /NCGR_PEP_ID=MMETSP0272-20121206/62804_1 /TAXON_ID=71861 /ORGANISM="Scrippsiella trochoidea, Strain CCMP3099" /LENGTH=51 /DNA_ID=CAMNT_0003131713 /DNA_START=22 /DNA_END=174 /DNA_ORIENTATION=-
MREPIMAAAPRRLAHAHAPLVRRVRRSLEALAVWAQAKEGHVGAAYDENEP